MEKEFIKKNNPSNVNKNKLNCGLFNNVDDHPSARVLMNQILNNNNDKKLNDNQYFKNDINISQNNNNNETLQKKDNNENNLNTITLNIPKN